MSAHGTTQATMTTTRQREVHAAKVLRRLAVGACATIALTAMAAAPEPAINQDHQDGAVPTQTTGPSTPPVPPNSHNYPKDDLGYQVPSSGSVGRQGDGLQATSVALGALGGIALAGAGLGIILGVQRRRDHTTPHTA
jgi:hypothetical protein